VVFSSSSLVLLLLLQKWRRCIYHRISSDEGESFLAGDWYGEAAQSIAPVGIMMAFFMLIYTIWFGFAWGTIGWLLFGLSVLLAGIITVKSIKNVKHSRLFAHNITTEGARINLAMGILSGVSYGLLWLFVIILMTIDLYILIMPFVTLIIGVHFIPQAKIMNRKLDYFVAPLPILSALFSFYLAAQPEASWLVVYAVASVGGAIATAIYGMYMLKTYQTLALENGVDY